MNEKLRNGLVNAGLVVVSVVVFFAALEGYFVVFNPQIFDAPSFAQHDETMGTVYKPNATGIFARAEFETQIKINSKGLRDREYDYSKPDGINRIVVLGDSFTWGYGVEEKEIFTEVLEDSLLKNVQVINTGVSGYGTGLELLFFKKEGVKYNPNLVIVAFFIGNDVSDTLKQSEYLLQSNLSILNDNNERILTDMSDPQKNKITNNGDIFLYYRDFIYKHSHTSAFIVNRLMSIHSTRKILIRLGIAGRVEYYTMGLFSNNYTSGTQYSWDLTKAILKEIDAVAKENDAKTLIVIIPCKLQLYDERWEAAKRLSGHTDQNYDISKPNDVLVNFGKENNIPVLDLLPEFRQYAENDEQLYFEIDGHWNANGHKLAAELIYDKLIEEQLIPLGGEE